MTKWVSEYRWSQGHASHLILCVAASCDGSGDAAASGRHQQSRAAGLPAQSVSPPADTGVGTGPHLQVLGGVQGCQKGLHDGESSPYVCGRK